MAAPPYSMTYKGSGQGESCVYLLWICTSAPSIVYSSAPIPALLLIRTLKRRTTKTEASVGKTTHITTRPTDLEEYMMIDKAKIL